jgi:hypothetical protein
LFTVLAFELIDGASNRGGSRRKWSFFDMRALVGLLLSVLMFGIAVSESANTHWSFSKGRGQSLHWEEILAFVLVTAGLVAEVRRPTHVGIRRGIGYAVIGVCAIWASWLALGLLMQVRAW